jgi:hypothetical protein
MGVLLAAALVLGGLHGTVTRGPTTPVCTVGIPCSAPATGALLLFERNGRVAARARVGAGGRYSIRLAPGSYLVVVAPKPRLGFGIRPRRVYVAGGRSKRVDLSIDTGIR